MSVKDPASIGLKQSNGKKPGINKGRRRGDPISQHEKQQQIEKANRKRAEKMRIRRKKEALERQKQEKLAQQTSNKSTETPNKEAQEKARIEARLNKAREQCFQICSSDISELESPADGLLRSFINVFADRAIDMPAQYPKDFDPLKRLQTSLRLFFKDMENFALHGHREGFKLDKDAFLAKLQEEGITGYEDKLNDEVYQTVRSKQDAQDIANVSNGLSSCISKIEQVSQHLSAATKQDPGLQEALSKVTESESPEALSKMLVGIIVVQLANFDEGTVGYDFAEQIPEELSNRMKKIIQQQ